MRDVSFLFWFKREPVAWPRDLICATRVTSFQQHIDIARQNFLTDRSEFADIVDKITHRFASANFLRIVGGEDQTLGRDLPQCRFYAADRAAEASRVEHKVLLQVIIEILLGCAAMFGVAAQAPEILVLITADAAEHRSDTAAEVSHLHNE